MTRVAIIGNAGGGKSTLARKLGQSLDLPVYEVDVFQWKPGWVRESADEVARVHAEWLGSPRWIIDGWGSWDALAVRFEQSDTIILIDFPIALHYWWAIKRHVRAIFQPDAPWPPPGCPALPVTWRLLTLMWQIHRDYRPRILELVARYHERKQVFHLRSSREFNQFVREYCHG